ncbi:carbohydrate kinase family protein [Nocardioides sp.]|uniref:carbohydrate kinase family protein n=1 Tax=Nocardioides sp. TaxID=35761 RepID=UPI0025FC128E|nr:carbohydrate kinase family protein [Nocardioides sp.]
MIVVVGGANLDVKAHSARDAVARTSNPGSVLRSAGGVGRNVAENVARLGTEVCLVAAVGTDPAGDEVLAATRAAGVDVSRVARVPQPTGTYVAVLDADGELVVAVSDMAATESIGPGDVDAAADAIAAASLVVLDGNLGTAALGRALEVCAATGARVVLDPVSVPKAAALAGLLSPRTPLWAVTPNRDELDALGGSAGALHDRGVELVWTRLGVAGSRLSSRDSSTDIAFIGAPEVLDVTGAGDAMLGAFCHAVLAGADPAEAAAYGQSAAALTVASAHTVRPDLTDELVRSLL